MNKGVIISGIGHLGLILWVLFAGFFSFPDDAPEVAVTTVSLVTSDQLAQMQQAANSTPEPAPTPEAAAAPEVTPPEPVQPEVTPVEPAPEPAPVEPQPVPEVVEPPPVEPVVDPLPEVIAPEPIAPPAAIEQPIPVPLSTVKPKPRPSVRVADTPVPPPPEDVAVADEVTPAVTDQPAPEAPVVEEPKPAAAPEEASPTIVTETTEPATDAPTLAPTSSIRPHKRPNKPAPVETATEAPAEPAADTAAADTAAADAAAADAAAADAAAAEAAAADAAVQAALNDVAGEATADTGADGGNTGTEGPPMTAGEKDAFRVSVEKNWNVAALSTEALRTTVIVYVAVGQDGTPDPTSIKMISFSGGSEAAANQAFQVARRAILRSGAEGFKLPADKYDTWKELELVFDSKGMGL